MHTSIQNFGFNKKYFMLKNDLFLIYLERVILWNIIIIWNNRFLFWYIKKIFQYSHDPS